VPMNNELFVDVDGIRTRYFEAGSGEPMLLLHGGNFGEQDNVDCANNWDLNWDIFAKDFHVFAIDRIGQGFTDNPAPGNYTIESIIAHIRGFIAKMNLSGVHLVGHSRGGYMSMRITLEDPGAVRTITIVDSATTSPRRNGFRERLRANAHKDRRSREGIAWITEEFSFSRDLITKEWMDVREAVAKQPKNDVAVAEVTAIYDSEFVPGLEVHKDETLGWIRDGKLKTPTLLVWGKNDPSAMLEGGLELLDIVAGSTPDAQMHIFNQAGHYCYREHPSEFANVVTTFIKGSVASQAAAMRA
jgi:2-hydroxy-6-oxonona-2,4-dienedioate hydrolase